MTSNHNTYHKSTIYIERGGVERTLTVSGWVTPYVRAKTSGHPDTWSPPEGGGAEIDSIKDDSGNQYSLDDADKLLLTPAEYDNALAALEEESSNSDPDDHYDESGHDDDHFDL